MEVGEEAALRHSDLIGEESESDTGEAGLAHEGEAMLENSFASGDRLRHGIENSTTGRAGQVKRAGLRATATIGPGGIAADIYPLRS